MSNNPRPHVFIPSPPLDTQQSAVPRGRVSPFVRQDISLAPPSRSPQLSPQRRQPTQMTLPPRPRIQSAPDHYPATAPISFSEPQSYPSISNSHRESLFPPSNRSNHRPSNNTYNSNDMGIPYTSPSVVSFASSYGEDGHYGLGSAEVCSPISSLLSSNSSVVRRCHGRFNTQIVCIIFCLFLRYRHLFHCKFHSLDAEEALFRFQAGELKENYEEWHLLVTPEACDALGKVEVQRQSVIFEIIKSERDYVADLEAVEQVRVAHPSCPIPSRLNNNFKVFIDQLQLATPPIMSVPNLNNFTHKVFGNLHEILVYHKQILAALYDRQRKEHPLILTIADIFLDGKSLLSFLGPLLIFF